MLPETIRARETNVNFPKSLRDEDEDCGRPDHV